MNSYFFIPVTKLHKLNSLNTESIDHVIIDLEDSVKASERHDLVQDLYIHKNAKNHYLRVPIVSSKNELDLSLIESFVIKGFTKFVLPKLNSKKQLDDFLSYLNFNTLDLILLIESPRLYLELQASIMSYVNCFKGLSLGSHDFISILGSKYNESNIFYLRQTVLIMARSLNIEAIDVASMDLQANDEFKNELKVGFEMGFDAKYIIHPNQLETLLDYRFYTKEDYEKASAIINEVELKGGKEEFDPFVFKGQVIEQPHINAAQKVLKFYK